MADTLFLQDILNTPRSLADTLAQVDSQVDQLAAALLERGARRFLALGNGSSLHAATAAVCLYNGLATPGGAAAWALSTSEHNLYPLPLAPADVLIGLSASGEVVDMLELFERLRGRQQLVGITNVAGSSLTRLVDELILMRAGPSLVPTSTKTYMASLGALDLLWLGLLKAQGIAAAEALRRELLAIPEAVSHSLAQAKGQAGAAAERLSHCKQLYIVGSGPALALAGEVALVFKEVAGLPAEAMQSREMAQGGIAVMREGVGVVGIAPPGRGQEPARHVLAQCAALGAATVEVGAPPAQIVLDVPCAELLSPLVYGGPLFMLAEGLAARRGVDPDHPWWEAAYLREVRRTPMS